jgi:hypothetical protein
MSLKIIVGALLGVVLVLPVAPSAEPVAVRHAEGLVHGFLSLRSLDGKLLASGDLIQNAQGNRVTTRLVFHFKDGSTSDETAVFSQDGHFQLLSDHLVQKGPAFDKPLDMTIDRASGKVTVKYKNDKGEEKVEDETMELPDDLANGIIIALLKNIKPDAPPASFSFVAATPKPRVVKLKVSTAADDPFSTAATSRKATHFVLKVDIGGLAGVVAPLVGKEPPDQHVWVLQGDAPAFVKSESTMFMGGPIWRMELVSPVWPKWKPTAASTQSRNTTEPRKK